MNPNQPVVDVPRMSSAVNNLVQQLAVATKAVTAAGCRTGPAGSPPTCPIPASWS